MKYEKRLLIELAEILRRKGLITGRLSLEEYFDAIFVLVAQQRAIPLLTSDRKLCRAVQGLIETQLLRGIESTE
ncbi:MAG: hypothetical protein ACREN8_07230 [Candidatus Dormibacteraceae bacterium]